MARIGLKGIKIGHAEDKESATGCSVIIIEEGAVCGVEVRGSAPGTRETDLLEPINLVEKVHAVLLSGGSAFGLDAACGVMKYLEEKNIGFNTGDAVVPIVPAAVIYDLNVGSSKIRPDFKMGYEACLKATDEVTEGSVGAGTGATVGKYMGIQRAMKGGVGFFDIKLRDLYIGAMMVVNSLGDVYDSESNRIVAGALNEQKTGLAGYEEYINSAKNKIFPGQNTTIGVVFTNAKLTKVEAKKVAQMAHDGLARAVRPVHTMYDGDTIFVLSLGEVTEDLSLIGELSARAVEKAVVNAVLKAESLCGIPSYKDIKI
ncbi:MAG: P1 family peptidase [Thermovenabulum sp.]|uniref:P1 family peptidase n=1 Tax=Thermovenabulum sp. TaxID=3100335 RepID=UPI003C7D70A1